MFDLQFEEQGEYEDAMTTITSAMDEVEEKYDQTAVLATVFCILTTIVERGNRGQREAVLFGCGLIAKMGGL